MRRCGGQVVQDERKQERVQFRAADGLEQGLFNPPCTLDPSGELSNHTLLGSAYEHSNLITLGYNPSSAIF